MERADLSLIAESYEEVKFNLFVERCLYEGKSVDEITDKILEEGLFSRMMSRFKSGLSSKDKRDRVKKMVTGKAAQYGQDVLSSKFGQKALDVAQKGIRGAQKLATKTAGAIGVDPRKVRQSGLYKASEKARKGISDTDKLDTKLAQTIETGREAASGYRSEKLQRLLVQHKDEIQNMFGGFQNSVLTLNKSIKSIFNDLNKIGGITTNPKKINQLKNDIRTSILIPFLKQGLDKPVDTQGLTKQVLTMITDFINKQKVSGKEGVGLRTKHKINPDTL